VLSPAVALAAVPALTVVVGVISLLLFAAIAVIAVRLQHYRREMQALLRRVGDLEEALARATAESVLPADALDGAAAQHNRRPAGDVLAGRTSHVRRVVDGTTGEPASMADEAIIWIHQHLGDPVTPRQLADDLCVTLRSLERGLSATLGCTPQQLMTAMKLREAQRLLLSGQLRVTEVGARLGFANPSHFSIRFKSFYGVSPSTLMKRREAQ
jgi:AraC-like DNA-binding protein